MSQPSFSRSQFPNGGWDFRDPRTGFSTHLPKSSTFSQVCEQILKNRKANPAAVLKHKLSLDLAVIGNELEAYTRLRCGIPEPKPLPMTMIPGIPAAVISGVADIKKLASGAGLLMEFDASGLPSVTTEVANSRARRCSGCPMNDIQRLKDWMTVPVAGALQSRTARITAMKLSTPEDSRLGLCNAIFAPCSTLVHIPDEVLNKKVKSATREECWSNCWLKS